MGRSASGMTAVVLLGSLGMVSCGNQEEVLDESGYGCDETAVAVSIEEVTDLGFSASDVLAVASGEFRETFAYTTGDTTGLTLAIAYGQGEIRYIQSQPSSQDSGEEIQLAAPLCEDRLEIDVTLTFQTDDGAFDETWDATLQSTVADEAGFTVAFSPDSLNGTYVIAPPEGVEGYDTVTATVDGRIGVEGTRGAVSVQYVGASESEDEGEGVAWVSVVTIGVWPPEDEGEGQDIAF